MLCRAIVSGQIDLLRAELERDIPYPHRQQFFGGSRGIESDPAQQDLRLGLIRRRPGGAAEQCSAARVWPEQDRASKESWSPRLAPPGG